ncbi:MAG TPA: putative phage abortive infection protein [Comamonas sp.]
MFKKAWEEIHLLELIAVFLLVCTVWFYGKAYLNFEANYSTWLSAANNGEGMSRAEALGLSGDFLGGVLNPILSFFSFLALLFTLRLQRRELNATMDELKKSTLAAEANVRLFTEQIRSQRLDAFENTFFSLLKLHNSTFETINEPLPAEGDLPAGSILQRLMAQARSEDSLVAARGVLMADHSEIDHFISILFEMLKFIDQKYPEDSHSDRMFYANILKAIINQDAFEAVAMYAATLDARDPFFEFKQLIEKYELLQELDLGAAKHKKFVAGYAQFFPQLHPASS